MAEKSAKRRMLEASLAEDPDDAFLRYGLAVQCLRDGDTEEGRARLRDLIADRPGEVAAYQMLGQSYLEAGETAPALDALRAGVQKALAAGDQHAAAEMQGLIEAAGG